MINKYLPLIITFILITSGVFAQTSIQGKVTLADDGEPVIYGDVALYKNGVLITGGQTDFDGNYSISNIEGGTYDIVASYLGVSPKRISGVQINSGKVTRVDFELSVGIDLEVIEIVEYVVPLIDVDNTSTGKTLTAKEIGKLGTKNINAIASLTPGMASTDGGAISARGSRSTGTDYYLDGIRVSGALIPQSEIEQITTIVGGIPASYGDVTGGLITIISRGPSQKLAGGFDIETSEFLDDFGTTLASGYVSGPILKGGVDKDKSVIGFRLSGRYTYREDDRPTATGVYRSTEAGIQDFTSNPFNENGILRTEFDQFAIHGGTLQLLNARPNQADRDINFTGKLDFRIAGNLDISISGNVNKSKNQFGGTGTSGARWETYNWTRNPYAYTDTYRGNFRLKHRLGSNSNSGESGEGKKTSAIRNVAYTIAGGYQLTQSDNQDEIHQDRIFDYGYVGDFTTLYIPAIGLDTLGNRSHVGYNQITRDYAPNTSGINEGWLALNREFEGDGNVPGIVTSFNAFNGGRNSAFTNAWGYHGNPGDIHNRINKSEAERLIVDVRTNFDFVPGGSDKGRHSIELGFLFEQWVSRSYTLAPAGLWNEARSRANSALSGVNRDIFLRLDTIEGTMIIDSIFAPGIAGDIENSFHSNIRNARGLDSFEFVNIDGISPSEMRLEWFRPQELADNGRVAFRGYDYLGNKVSNDATFDDFFADRNGDGFQDFVVAPTKPNYLAAFIQDRFSYEDIIFRLGLRVERYDANTRVLKDQFSLYEIMTASEFESTTGKELPEGVQDNYKVYVNGPDSDDAVGFRVDEQWYNKEGAAIKNGSLLFNGAPVTPYYKIRDSDERNIQNPYYAASLDQSFVDYDPQINFAPRLSFSFPISEASNFFANYDILYQRPSGANVYTALDYFYFEQNAATNRTNSNPNLQPTKTTQYEIGFNQKVSNSSAITIQAFYKEERDRIQTRTLLNVASPIGEYTTFDNIDFATVKGFSFAYDLRRTGNVQVNANYTLLFAEGTGSNLTTQETLASTGINIRTISALDFDERHRFNVVFDFRYKGGKKYNGPQVFGADIFANAGANLQLLAVSGQPYTKTDFPTAFGGDGFSGALNENRLPWTSTLDLRIDKDFTLFRGEESKKPLSFNLYFRVQNLLNAENVRGVYTFSGDPDNSGFLAHDRGQSLINSTTNGEASGLGTVASFLDLYSAAALQPGFFTLPRRMSLGLQFNF